MSNAPRWAAVVVLFGVAGWMGACGTKGSDAAPGTGDAGGAGGDDASGDVGQGFTVPDANVDASQTLRIEPAAATVDGTGTLASVTGSQTFQAYLSGSSAPVAANWSLDDVAVGSISQSGVFTANPVANSAVVTARIGDLSATATITVRLTLEENPAGLTDSDKARLRAGGTADTANFTWLYPYDKTIFPRGLLSPTLQFGGTSPASFYVKVQASGLHYEGFYAPTPGNGNAARLLVPDPLWRAITLSARAGDSVTTEVTKLDAAGVTGPIRESWGIAQGSLKGTVYYNSYASPGTLNGGAILRIKPGKRAEIFADGVTFDGGAPTACVTCHSVNARGSTFVAGIDYVDTDDAGTPLERPVRSAVFDLASVTSTTPTPAYADQDGRKFAFGALSPDGKWALGCGKYPNSSVNARAMGSYVDDFPSRLYDTSNGAPVSDGYFSSASQYAVGAAFSPDGAFVTFSDRGADAGAPGGTLALLDFDATKNPPAFSGYTVLATSASSVLAWPSVAADDRVILYQDGDHYDTGGFQPTPTPLTPFHGDIAWVERTSKTTAKLDALNGHAAGGACILPYGDAEDCRLNYEPTVLPAAVGGYYWVVFTSRRSYGNIIYNGPNSINATGDGAFDNSDGHRYRKKLWVAAIDISGAPGADISHPAFYLEGQEQLAGNMRGFWALDPCRQNGDTCETGDDCCGGYCRQAQGADGGVAQLCVPPPSGCANDSEKCRADADCCGAPNGVKCIQNVCTMPTPTPPK